MAAPVTGETRYFGYWRLRVGVPDLDEDPRVVARQEHVPGMKPTAGHGGRQGTEFEVAV